MQNEPMFQVQVDESEDSEWNDILRAKGIIPEKPPSPTQQLEEAFEEAIAKQHANRLENKSLEELDELEDEEDEEFLESYRRKRMLELAQQRARSKFGQVFHINKPEYSDEVTIASQGGSNEERKPENSDAVYVFVHLSLESKIQSRILSNIFNKLAPKFPEIKFVEIPANRAIENYPEINCPTVLVYYNGDVVKKLITLLEIGGNSTDIESFEEFMIDTGSIKEDDRRLLKNQDDYDSGGNGNGPRSSRTKIKGSKSIINSSSILGLQKEDDDDDFFD